MRALFVEVEIETRKIALEKLSDQAAWIRHACRDADGGYRWTTAATVSAAYLLAAQGVDVPVSGDAGVRWLGRK